MRILALSTAADRAKEGCESRVALTALTDAVQLLAQGL